MNLKNRSYSRELLDEENVPDDALKQNLKELNFINTWLGGHAITIAGLKEFCSKRTISICEIGCGGGDNISALNNWCRKHNIHATFIGVDIKPVCIEFAKQKLHFDNISWIADDYKNVRFDVKPDVIFSSLFCHHFTNDQLIFQLRWMKENSLKGFFINDLERNFLAYHSIKWLSKAFSKSYLVKHDAPLSVARGFRRLEWKSLLAKAHISSYKMFSKWAFRHLVIYKHA